MISAGVLVKLNSTMGSEMKLFKTAMEDSDCQVTLGTIAAGDIAVVIDATRVSIRVMTTSGAIGWLHRAYFKEL